MQPDRWSRIKAILDAALDLGSTERERLLDERCAGDADLRREVESLLVAHEDLERTAGFFGAEDLPERIGPYRIVRPIARGGMGVVYLAEQLEPIRREVAVKLIKIGMDTREVVARFEIERQALALMSHPHIAAVLDAGSTEGGRPYFVMEYVPGVPITDYCDTHRLEIAERLGLFLKVCDAIQHAHQKGVIHRDIKPSNVLVMRRDEEVTPKVIDFGIAKATSLQLVRQTLHTRAGAMIGTPEYVSPEQASLTEAGVDTRTDVYSLGVLLYELLTGQLPFGRTGDPETPLDEILRRIRLEEPTRPSVRVAALGQAAEAVARSRRSDLRAVVSTLRRDLDWIVLRAIEKDPARRYASASELAAEIRRHLADQPVEARPPSAAYRTRKFVRRHPLGVAISCVAVAAVIGVALLLGAQTHRIAQERDRANREAESARVVSEFLVGLFDDVAPGKSRRRDVSAIEIVDRGAARIESALRMDPTVRADVLSSLGEVYTGLGQTERADWLLAEALSLQGATDRVASLRRATTLEKVARLRAIMSDHDEAIDTQREVVSTRKRFQGERHADVGESLRRLADYLRKATRGEEALAVATEAATILREARGADDPSVAAAVNVLADVHNLLGDQQAALDLHLRALDIRLRTLGRPHPEVAESYFEIGTAYSMLGRHVDAQRALEEARTDFEQLLPPDHFSMGMTYGALGSQMIRNGEVDTGVALLLQGLRIEGDATGRESLNYGTGAIEAGFRLSEIGHDAEAADRLLEGLSVLERRFGTLGGHSQSALDDYVAVLRRLGRMAEAARIEATGSVLNDGRPEP